MPKIRKVKDTRLPPGKYRDMSKPSKYRDMSKPGKYRDMSKTMCKSSIMSKIKIAKDTCLPKISKV